jgi:hypothetical protein
MVAAGLGFCLMPDRFEHPGVRMLRPEGVDLPRRLNRSGAAAMAGSIARWIDCDRRTSDRQAKGRHPSKTAADRQAQADCAAYFSILLCNCQKRTVRWAVSIDSFR